MNDIVLMDGYAIVAENGEYIIMEQTGNTDIDVMTTPYADYSQLFDTYEKAQEKGKEIVTNNGYWSYWIHSQPVGVVKIEKTIKIGIVKGLK